MGGTVGMGGAGTETVERKKIPNQEEFEERKKEMCVPRYTRIHYTVSTYCRKKVIWFFFLWDEVGDY